VNKANIECQRSKCIDSSISRIACQFRRHDMLKTKTDPHIANSLAVAQSRESRACTVMVDSTKKFKLLYKSSVTSPISNFDS
jgi:hypothetical protein